MVDTVLTGVKPTGSPHLGNLYGAIWPVIEIANNTDSSAYIFIADVHALNGVKDSTFLRDKTYEVAVIFLACGLDINKAVFYRQSDVPEIFELTSILMNFTPKGLMNRAHAYKAMLDKDGNDDNVNMGLFTYPILMASDILSMGANLVPVGIDQKQHIEIARDIANAFNFVYKTDVLTLPNEFIQIEEPILGLDGRKMSKSYNNTIEVFASEEETKKKIMKIPTDSLLPADKKSEDCALYKIMRMFPHKDKKYVDNFLKGGIGYGDAKKELAEAVNAYLAPYREKYKELMADKSVINEMLKSGAVKARARARETLDAVKKAVGLI